MTKPVINVAIGLVFHAGKVLVGWREAKQHQGNKYEFPGGKVEQGEEPIDACRREILEETGLDIENWHVFDFIEHEYEDVVVKLHLFHGVADSSLESLLQPWAWYGREELSQLNFPKANDDIIRRLALPKILKITQYIESSVIDEHQWIYFRVGTEKIEHFIEFLKQLSNEQLNKIIVNIDIWKNLPNRIQDQIETIHYKHSQLMTLISGHLLTGKRTIAACHDFESATHAEKLGCDCVLLSPVLATETHPDATPLEWEHFAEITKRMQIPVFALGGLTPDDIDIAQHNGAYGIAGVSAF